MAFDVVVTLLSNAALASVFKTIAEKRTVQFKDIRDLLPKTLGAVPTESELKQAVATLKEADLIKERPAPIDDFATYYVTADGLNVQRALERTKTLSSSTAS